MDNTNLLLTIIIPTYNNPAALERNLLLLCEYAREMGDPYRIIIADDGSTAENKHSIEQALDRIKSDIIEYYYHENVGLEANELLLIGKVQTKYAMLLGEDDYLQPAYLKKVIGYLENNEVGAILSNFFSIDEDGNRIKRGCRNRMRKDRIYERPNFKLIFLAHQMSGLVFQVDGLQEYYKNNVLSNVYPQLSYIAHSLDKGINIHITDAPFACTVLKKRRFNYSVDGLIYDLLKNIIAYADTKKRRKKMINYFLRKWQGQFCNLASWKHPVKFLRKVKDYKALTCGERFKIKMTFLLSYLTVPFRVTYRFLILPLIGKREQKTIGYKEYRFE